MLRFFFSTNQWSPETEAVCTLIITLWQNPSKDFTDWLAKRAWTESNVRTDLAAYIDVNLSSQVELESRMLTYRRQTLSSNTAWVVFWPVVRIQNHFFPDVIPVWENSCSNMSIIQCSVRFFWQGLSNDQDSRRVPVTCVCQLTGNVALILTLEQFFQLYTQWKSTLQADRCAWIAWWRVTSRALIAIIWSSYDNDHKSGCMRTVSFTGFRWHLQCSAVVPTRVENVAVAKRGIVQLSEVATITSKSI